MACRKMNEDVAYARNTESGCNFLKQGQYVLHALSFPSMYKILSKQR